MQLAGGQASNCRALSGPNVRKHPTAHAHDAQRTRPQCTAQAAAPAVEKLQPKNLLLVKAVELLFSVKPIFAWASAAARQRIVDRSKVIGLDFEGEVQRLQTEADWDAMLAEATDLDVAIPAYYTKPFHAYDMGNLCWEAAMEFEVASRSVHCSVLDDRPDPQGDDKFRAAFMNIAKRSMAEAGARDVSDAVDLGCATGLSSMHVSRAFPDAQVTGCDLSPHMVAVGRHLQQRLGGQHGAEPLRLRHANAESTGLPAESADLVTLCLVAHELPADATANIFHEAHRLLRPGGTLAIMEMDPQSPIWRRIFGNPAAFVAFKATEPWLMEYVGLDMDGALAAAGFLPPQTASNSPRHKTVVVVKPR